LRVYVNGETREFSETISLDQLVDQLELPAMRLAIEVNRKVVRRADWVATKLHDGDHIEIVHFVGGGGIEAGGGSRGRIEISFIG
jgi:thiamine biosynthesis protein ThiS